MKTKANAIINFAYFTANFTYGFIDQCWKDEPHLIDHLKTKFISKSQDGIAINCGDFIHFFFELDRGNQVKLANWIDENYKGIYE